VNDVIQPVQACRRLIELGGKRLSYILPARRLSVAKVVDHLELCNVKVVNQDIAPLIFGLLLLYFGGLITKK